MRIFIAGASGVIGRELLPMLSGHEVVGATRRHPEVVAALGAAPVVMDVYDRRRVRELVAAARPEVVVSLLTDLAASDFAANSRIRREGAPNLFDAAVAAGARRLIVESISFPAGPEGSAAVEAMERHARDSGLDAVVLRFGLLWGPGTWYDGPGTDGEYIHVRDAAAAVRDAIFATG